MEVWKEIKDYPFYQVSNLGRVKSLRCGKEKIMKLSNMKGYRTAPLKDKVKKNCVVHRLVAIAFIPNLENKPFINHINGIKHDNRVENLEWCTQKENVLHSHQMGLCSDKRGEGNGRAVIKESQVLEIRKIEGKRTSQIARDYGVSWSCIDEIRKNKSWTHI